VIKKTIKYLGFFLTISILLSCSKQNKEIVNEIVMSPGMTIEAKNENGDIVIKADNVLQRIYGWDGNMVKIKMLPRDKRWDGSLGIYSPSSDKEVHMVVEEGQQHFNSSKEAIEWLSWQNNRMKYVYTSNGLVIGWYKTKNATSVQVWQFYICGHKPTNLPGAKDNLIKISFAKGVLPQDIKVGHFLSNKPQKIAGRWYSGKAIDMMQEKNITPEKVEKTIAEGKLETQEKYFYYYSLNDNEVTWVMLDKQRDIILVGN
jgi:hypothetical protein